jgi:hypothetical protein
MAGFLTSCKKDKGDPPVLPPQESMTIDFTNFVEAKKSADVIFDQKGTENSHWAFAALAAGVWKVIINTTLAVPVASFRYAIDQDPAFLSNKTWQWSYTVPVLTVNYKARLTGQIGATEVVWKMYITREGTGGFAEFLWFEGTSKIDGTGGRWTLNQSSESPIIKYKYVKNDSYKNNYIEYVLTTGTLNAKYTIQYYNGAKLSDVNVEWNTTTYNGRVKSVDYLGDSNWYCWGTNKINIACI